MNISSLEGLVNNTKSTANDTQKLLERNALKSDFVRRLTRIHDNFLGYVDFMKKNLDFFIKNGLVDADKYNNGYAPITSYKIGQSKGFHGYKKDSILEVRVTDSEICQLCVANINEEEVKDFGLNPKWAGDYYSHINFFTGVTREDKFSDILANFDQPSWYKNFTSVENFKKDLDRSEVYYLEILPKMIEVCLCRIKEEVERKNAVIRSTVGNEKKNVRKITITITEE